MVPIPGFPRYHATADGAILGTTGRPLRPRAHHRTGHLRVRLYGPGAGQGVHVVGKSGNRVRSRHRDVYVHVLVCLAYHGPPPFEGALVLHADDCPTNNRPDNLRWGSHLENMKDRKLNKALKDPRDSQGFCWATGVQT